MKSLSILDISDKFSFINIPNGEYFIDRNGERYGKNFTGFQCMDKLITNKEYIEWINDKRIKNHFGGTYKLFNDVNGTNEIYFDKKSGRYEIVEGGEELPFRGATWKGADLFAKFFGCKLLSELEWEIIACSGNQNNIYPWGQEKPNYTKANYNNFYGTVTNAKLFEPNNWGVYDMAGNLREWCMDDYHPDYPYLEDFPINDISSMYKVVRGGAWDKGEMHLKCATRAGKWGRVGTMGIGFRLCRIIKS